MGTFDLDNILQEEHDQRLEAARKCMTQFLESHPKGVELRDMFRHFFPPNPLPFSREEFAEVFRSELWSGIIEMDEHRVVRLSKE